MTVDQSGLSAPNCRGALWNKQKLSTSQAPLHLQMGCKGRAGFATSLCDSQRDYLCSRLGRFNRQPIREGNDLWCSSRLRLDKSKKWRQPCLYLGTLLGHGVSIWSQCALAASEKHWTLTLDGGAVCHNPEAGLAWSLWQKCCRVASPLHSRVRRATVNDCAGIDHEPSLPRGLHWKKRHLE